MSRTIKNQHRLLNALREHGDLILIGISEEEGYFAPWNDLFKIPPKALLAGESGALIRMHGPDYSSDVPFEHLIGIGGKVSSNLIFMAGADQLKPIEEFDVSVEEKADNLSHRTIKGTWELSEEALSPKILRNGVFEKAANSKYPNGYIVLLANHAVYVAQDKIHARSFKKLSEASDVVFKVSEDTVSELKSRDEQARHNLADLVLNRKVIVIDNAINDWAESWTDLRHALLHCVEPTLLVSALRHYDARAPWLENSSSSSNETNSGRKEMSEDKVVSEPHARKFLIALTKRYFFMVNAYQLPNSLIETAEAIVQLKGKERQVLKARNQDVVTKLLELDQYSTLPMMPSALFGFNRVRALDWAVFKAEVMENEESLGAAAEKLFNAAELPDAPENKEDASD